MRCLRTRGFTLLEMAVALAVVAILAAVAGYAMRSSGRNANLSSATYDLVMRLSGLRATAMAQGKDYLFVVADAPSSDATSCRASAPGNCTQYWVLAAPTATWSLGSFDPTDPAANASLDSTLGADAVSLPKGIHLDLASTAAPPVPFAGVPLFESAFTPTCGSTRKCFAIRFASTGKVSPEPSADTAGYAFVLTSDLEGTGVEHRGIVVSFPTAIVKTFAY